MKVCPVCRAEYDDDVEVCANDGETLIEGAEALPENPSLQDVIAVAPDDATAMVDLEALEDKFRARAEARAEQDAQREAEEAERRAREERLADPEATGTLLRQREPDKLRSRLAPDEGEGEEFDEGEDQTAPSLPDGDRTQRGGGAPTSGLGRKAVPTQLVRPKSAPKGSRRGCLIVGILLLGVLGAGGAGFAIYMTIGPGAGVGLTVTTAPPGATVVLDGDVRGTSPLQTRVKPGSHTIELKLAGFESFKEVIDVPPEGMPFLQPLKAIAGYTPPEPEDDGGRADDGGLPPAETRSDALVAEIERALDQGDADAALEKVKMLLKEAPDDPRADALFHRATTAKVAASEPDGADEGRRRSRRREARRGRRETKPPEDEPAPEPVTADKKQAAQDAYREGERLYKNGRLIEAKRQFKRALQLDPRFYLPHRSLARVYQREKNIPSARYHLQRYLKLGGPDADFKVRRWLENNPP